MSRRRTGVIRPGMLLMVLIGFLAMHGMSATTPAAGHHGITTLATHTHDTAAEDPGFLTAISSDGTASVHENALTEHIAAPIGGSDRGVVTSGCVVALAGFLGLLAFLARLRSGRRGHSRRSPTKYCIDAVVQRNIPPPAQQRLHISLCVLRV